MNPFEKIAQLKTSLLEEAKSNNVNLNDSISYREHYQKVLNILNILEIDLQTARYNFVVERLPNQQVHVFDEMTVTSNELEEGILLFQPVSNNGEDVTAVDMASLYAILFEAYNSGQITHNMIVLPPGVNMFYAQLEESEQDIEDTEEE